MQHQLTWRNESILRTPLSSFLQFASGLVGIWFWDSGIACESKVFTVYCIHVVVGYKRNFCLRLAQIRNCQD